MSKPRKPPRRGLAHARRTAEAWEAPMPVTSAERAAIERQSDEARRMASESGANNVKQYASQAIVQG